MIKKTSDEATYVAKNFSSLMGIKGLSENLLKTHFALYEGYIGNTNKLIEKLLSIARSGGDLSAPEFAEMKRRFGWEWNGMRLHELYFENITKNSVLLDKNSSFAQKTAKNFGSIELWEKAFRATGMMRGIGWVVAYYDPLGDKIFNLWINEHDGGHLAGLKPILVMDMFEHAFMPDYGTKKADYIAAFFGIIDWNIVTQRFDAAISNK